MISVRLGSRMSCSISLSAGGISGVIGCVGAGAATIIGQVLPTAQQPSIRRTAYRTVAVIPRLVVATHRSFLADPRLLRCAWIEIRGGALNDRRSAALRVQLAKPGGKGRRSPDPVSAGVTTGQASDADARQSMPDFADAAVP